MKTSLKINGMHCKSCVNLIKLVLEENNVKANVEIGKADIEFNEKQTSLDKIKEIIKEQGYEIV